MSSVLFYIERNIYSLTVFDILLRMLEAPDTFHLLAAQGWLELGNHLEATEELENITPSLRSHPDVLEVRWHIYEKVEQWEACFDIGIALVQLAPERPAGWQHRSVALHKLNRTQEAYDALYPALQKFPKDWPVAYDMACYACQLGRLEEARKLLNKVFVWSDEKNIKQLALDDPDLAKVWAEA